MKSASHPPFSPDLAPSAFYLLDKLKTALSGEKFGDEHELSESVMKVLDTIACDELEAGFDEWLVRLDTCPQRGGEYVEEDESIQQGCILQSLSYLLMPNVNGPHCKQLSALLYRCELDVYCGKSCNLRNAEELDRSG
jgi:hypothetical protein